jgi:hypothetical protein
MSAVVELDGVGKTYPGGVTALREVGLRVERGELAAIVANSHACHRWLSAEPPNVERAKITTERDLRVAALELED